MGSNVKQANLIYDTKIRLICEILKSAGNDYPLYDYMMLSLLSLFHHHVSIMKQEHTMNYTKTEHRYLVLFIS